jgi:hypothetical protein
MSKAFTLASSFGHKMPTAFDGGAFFHSNKVDGKIWAYCTKCHALGGVNERGETFGSATTMYCAGSKKVYTKAAVRHVAAAK